MPSSSNFFSGDLESLTCMLTRVPHTGRTVLSTTAVQQLALLPTNSAPRPTREPSTQAFAPSTVLASLVGNGPRVASNSRALPELPGRYHDGLLLREPFLSLAPKTQLPLQPKAATKRTRKMETKPTACPAKTIAFLTATAAPMSRCKARLASRPHHRHPLLWPLHHNISHQAFSFIFISFLFLHFTMQRVFSSYSLLCFKPRKKLGLRLSAFCFIGSEDGNSGNMIISCLFYKATASCRWALAEGIELPVIKGLAQAGVSGSLSA